jgi:S-adenosylmethionine-diacylglycerol 3-amino-3-carboxypropyl transferase
VSEALQADSRPFSRYVLLDHLDWMADHQPELVAEEWRWIMHRATPGARAIWRSAHPEPAWMAGQGVDGLPLSHHWTLDRTLAERLHPFDRVGTYAGFHIAHLQGKA